MRTWTHWLVGSALAAAALAAPTGAAAQEIEEPWFFTGDLGVAGPINDNADVLFGLGGEGSFGVYRSVIPEVAFGGRIGVGVLSEGDPLTVFPGEVDLRQRVDRPGTTPPPQAPSLPPVRPVLPEPPAPVLPPAPIEPGQQGQQVQYGVLDYEYLTANIRVRPLARLLDDDRRATGLYLDAGAGIGLLDGDFAPFFDGAVGWNFGIGPIAIGPKFRFTHAVELNGRFGDDDILVWMGGLEVGFLDQVTRVQPATAEADVELPPGAETEARADLLDSDGDGIADADDRCPDEAEVYNGYADADGCPDEGVGEFVNDALVVDERVFFDYDGAELRPEGIEQLDAVVEHYRQYGERYDRLVISGHTDTRGTIDYNEGLSRERADAVVEYLVAQGIPRDVIEVEAYGELRPAIPDAANEFEHQVNRRVAFRVDWAEGQEPEGVPPMAEPTMPEVIDEAPESVQRREMLPEIQEREARESAIAEAELEQAPEEERLALETEREATERLAAEVELAELELAEAEVELQEPQAQAEIDLQEPQARAEIQEPQAFE